MNFYNNYVACCNRVGKSPSGVALEIGLSKPSVNRWKNGGLPTDATLRKVADYFGVSTDELLYEEIKKEPVPVQDELPDDVRAIIDMVKHLPEEKLRLLLPMIKAAAEAD